MVLNIYIYKISFLKLNFKAHKALIVLSNSVGFCFMANILDVKRKFFFHFVLTLVKLLRGF